MSLFDDYMKNRDAQNATTAAKAESKGFSDDTYWKPKYHKDTGTGYAVIRFLPGLNPEEAPWVKTMDHYFKSPVSGQTYWEQSLTTIGKKDPLGKLNSKLWNHGDEKYKEIARRQKRRTSYTANVLVITDPDNPAAEGKVFKYKFGAKVYQKIQNAIKPEFQDEKPIKPFDMFEGANFTIKITTGEGGYPSYEPSKFSEVTGPISEDTDKMREIFEAQHDISSLLDPNEFKSYEELEEILIDVVGQELSEFFTDEIQASTPASEERMDAASFGGGTSATTTTTETEAEPVAAATETASVDEDDEDLSDFFAKMEEE